MREDFNDVAMEVIKSASLGSIGKAVGVDPATKNEVAFEDDARANEAYCDVLASLLECYFDSFSELDGWYASDCIEAERTRIQFEPCTYIHT